MRPRVSRSAQDSKGRDGYERRERPEGGREFTERRERPGGGRRFSDRKEGFGERRSFSGRREHPGEGRSFSGRKEGFGAGRSFSGRRERPGEGRRFSDRKEGFGAGRRFSDRKEGFGEGRRFSDRKEGFGAGRRFSDRKEGFGAGRGFSDRKEGSGTGRRFSDRKEGFGTGRRFSDRKEGFGTGRRFSDRKEGFGAGRRFSDRKEGFGGKRSFSGRGGRPQDRRFSPKRERVPEEEEQQIMKASAPVAVKDNDGKIRLNKFIANSGLCSRREADEYITAGLVSVNGEVVTEMGVKVSPEDEVKFNGERIRSERKVYILMNKPKDFVTTVSDPHAEKNVMELISTEMCPERVFPVGRLDKSTTGVLLFTNDGELAEKLTHPSYQKKKIYQATLDHNMKGTDLNRLVEGIELEDGMAYADEASYVGEDKDVVGLEIHSGRNRIVRRMFEALDYKVRKLDRVYFAGLTKKNLRRGQWRFLSEEEVTMLKLNFYE